MWHTTTPTEFRSIPGYGYGHSHIYVL